MRAGTIIDATLDAPPIEAAVADGGAGDGGQDATVEAAAAQDAADAAGEGGLLDATADDQADAGDGGPCLGVLCNGVCLPASSCDSCSGAPLLCRGGGTCVADCAGCADPLAVAMPVQCFACDATHSHPTGTCEYADAAAYCLNGDYVGHYPAGPGYRCACNEATDCPGATQVCVSFGNASFCLNCGEPTLQVIDGRPCKSGGSCNESHATCP